MHACTCAYTYSNLQWFFIIPDNALHIGLVTRSLLWKLLDEGDISDRQVKTFYNAVRQFYERAAEYAISNLPLHDETLKSAQFLNFDSEKQLCFRMFYHLFKLFSNN